MIVWYDKPIKKKLNEVKENEVVRTEYGDFDNWVNMIIKKVSIQDKKELSDKAISKYSAWIRTDFVYENKTGLDTQLYDGYHSEYFNNEDDIRYEVHGYWKED